MAKRTNTPAATQGNEPTAAEAVLAKYPVLENPNTVLVLNTNTGLVTAVSATQYRLAMKKQKSAKSPLAGTVIQYMTDDNGTITDASGNPI